MKAVTRGVLIATTLATLPMVAQAANISDGANCRIYADTPYYGNQGAVVGKVSRGGTGCAPGEVTGKLIHAKWGPDYVVSSFQQRMTTGRRWISGGGSSGDVYFTKIYGVKGESVASNSFTY